MNKKLLLLISTLLLVGLVACGNTSSSETPAPSSSETPVSSEVSSEKPSSETPVSSEDEGDTGGDVGGDTGGDVGGDTGDTGGDTGDTGGNTGNTGGDVGGDTGDTTDTPAAEGISIIANGKLVDYVTETPGGSDKYKLNVNLEKDATVYFYNDAVALVVGNENAESYTAPKSGNYTIYINAESKVYPVLNSVTACTTYTLEVNGTVNTEASVTPDSGNYAQFKVTLAVEDVVTIKGDSTGLYSYTCVVEGEHIFYVNNKHEVTTKAPTAANVIRVEFEVPDWATSAPRIHYWGSTNTESLGLFSVGADSNMTQVDDGRVYYIELDPTQTYDGCIIIFDQNQDLKHSADLDLSSVTLTAGKAYTITMDANGWYDRGDGTWVFPISISEKA